LITLKDIMKIPSHRAVAVRVVIGLLGWFALILQLYLIIDVNQKNNVPVVYGIINYFSFFTILTNILVALTVTLPLVSAGSRLGRFFSRPGVQSAIALHIAVVGITYSLLLRHIWNPQGLQLAADRLLHDVIPILYLLYWFIFVPKGTLQWRGLLWWLIYPLVYLIYSIIRGAVTGRYPYPFLEVNKLGAQKVTITCLVMMLGFVGIGLIIIALDRIIGRNKPRTAL
jgi:hypothetical protein